MNESLQQNNSSLKSFFISLIATVIVVAIGYVGYVFLAKKEDSKIIPSLVKQQEKTNKKGTTVEDIQPTSSQVSDVKEAPTQAQQNIEDDEVPVIPQPILEGDIQETAKPEQKQRVPVEMKLYPMTVKTTAVSAELAETREQQESGLGGRTSLAEDRGLLYILAKPDFYTFWMKNMKFPIDIIWIDKNQKIVDITHSLTPDTYPKIFQPVEPAQIILEVVAGFAKKHDIHIGDPVTIPKIQ